MRFRNRYPSVMYAVLALSMCDVGEFTEFTIRLPRDARARVSAEGGGAAPSSSWPGSTHGGPV